MSKSSMDIQEAKVENVLEKGTNEGADGSLMESIRRGVAAFFFSDEMKADAETLLVRRRVDRCYSGVDYRRKKRLRKISRESRRRNRSKTWGGRN